MQDLRRKLVMLMAITVKWFLKNKVKSTDITFVFSLSNIHQDIFALGFSQARATLNCFRIHVLIKNIHCKNNFQKTH